MTPPTETREMSTETIEQSTIRVAGVQFRCACGCNVFHRVKSKQAPIVYECNVCRSWYAGEAAHV